MTIPEDIRRNPDFMLLQGQGMTQELLKENIQKRPALWRKFSEFMSYLPSRAKRR